MLTAKFWADGRREVKVPDKRRPVVLRRAGWSDLSQADAEAHAARRLDDAELRLLAGDGPPRLERRVAYNGADGVPIREEVVAEEAGAVFTRNVYGAVCMNVEDVLFADVDVYEPIYATNREMFAVAAGLVLVAFCAGIGWKPGLIALVLVAVALVSGVARRSERRQTTPRERLEAWVAAHPSWRVRLYQTPAGFRMAALHRRFRSDDPEVDAFFAAVDADPVYVQMCRHQRCFRARVTAKPWRVGVGRMGSPVWPVLDADRLARRRAWVEAYDRVAAGAQACRVVSDLGAGAADPGVEAVLAVHDRWSRATSELPLA